MEDFSLATLLLGSAALILMLWQWPDRDRHIHACLAGAVIWCALAFWDPGLDTGKAFLPALCLFFMALVRPSLRGQPRHGDLRPPGTK